ncbi:hypothetical protein CBP51_16770 [Cellvibrio mixtus]|uniref:Uncharacterized protein n=1 Tax=Cellvibrio mixtus TaxID=39650 RepID=A0A266Q4K8_9GAMM|nr:hypothetical protein [Cellvibrio mixtus]OZY84814.1 hypothetical protein CBP51_16770 [Cellvibrio mixtus]
MTVTIYRSTDVGAPALPASGNYNAANFYIELLKKCLVDGYESKPGAGWSVIYDDTTPGKRRAAFGNGNGCIEFITWRTQSLGILIWDSITTPGVGRLVDDSFSSVMSTGINGWKSAFNPAPGVASGNINLIHMPTVNSGQSANVAWTIFADDKSAWVLFHYPSSNGNSVISSMPSTSDAYHSQVFFGALKSPDLLRTQLGNFFILNGQRAAGTSTSPTSVSQSSWSLMCGLRTPSNTLPSVANASTFSWLIWGQSVSGNFIANPRSSVRLLLPIVVTYNGTDVDKPTSVPSANAHYAFATIPGIAEFSEFGNSNTSSYWIYCNQDRGASWNMQPYTVNTEDWMPWSATSTYLNLGITDAANWWA